MATQRLCGAVNDNIAKSATRTMLQDGLEEMASELNARTSHSYEAYGPKDHYWDAPTAYVDNNDSQSDETQYLGDFIGDIGDAGDAGEITVNDGDAWVIIDAFGDKDFGEYGYGKSIDDIIEYTGGEYISLWGARATAFGQTAFVDSPSELTKTFVKHELGHNFGCFHKHGSYGLNSDFDIKDVTNMATSYVRDVYGNADTRYKGTGSTPGVDNSNRFCGDMKNKNYAEYCGTVPNKCRHKLNGYTYCADAISTIESNTPLN